jgi:hypothetical protein
MESPQEKLKKEAADLLAQFQEAREKPQLVLQERNQLLTALAALLPKLERWGNPHDEKMAETISAIMDHMCALIEQSK